MTAKLVKYDYSNLLGLMRQKGFRQEDLAREIGINPSTLNQKLANKSDFTQSEIRRICRVLGIPLENVSEYFFCVQTLENAS